MSKRVAAASLAVSAACVAGIAAHEGYVGQAYRDPVGIWTIGYGCTGEPVHQGLTITQQQADDMLSNRLAQEFEPKVMAELGNVPTTQGQFDAMVSLAFNIGTGRIEHGQGEGGFDGSSVARFHKAGEYDKAADAFLLWDKAGGQVVDALDRRRAEEGQVYLDASPTS